MAAVAAALSLVLIGGVVVAPHSAYNGTLATLKEREKRGELTVRTVELTDTAATVHALAGADLVWLESPTNPLLEVADLEALVEAARAAGVLSVVDNTFATPLAQRPLELGSDLVVHSVTKYLGGHSDVILGACVVREDCLEFALANGEKFGIWGGMSERERRRLRRQRALARAARSRAPSGPARPGPKRATIAAIASPPAAVSR